jgi:hypothetical protein
MRNGNNLDAIYKSRSIAVKALPGHPTAANATSSTPAESRSFGITFSADSVMLRRVNSTGMLPICHHRHQDVEADVLLVVLQHIHERRRPGEEAAISIKQRVRNRWI